MKKDEKGLAKKDEKGQQHDEENELEQVSEEKRRERKRNGPEKGRKELKRMWEEELRSGKQLKKKQR